MALGASWGPDDTIVFAPSYNTGLFRISADGGQPQPVTSLDKERKEVSHNWPQFLPGGETILFTVENSGRSFADATIVAQSLANGERKVLVEGGTFAHYIPTGHLVYARNDALMAVVFDPKRLQVTGSPVQVGSGVVFGRGIGNSNYTLAHNGTLAYLPGGNAGLRNELVAVDRTGQSRLLTEKQTPYVSVEMSPDGKFVAAWVGSSNDDIWLLDVQRQTQTRLTFEGENTNPVWTSNGEKIIISSDFEGPVHNLYAIPMDGNGVMERLTTSEAMQKPLSCSPNGRLLAYSQRSVATGDDIWLLPLDGAGKPRSFRNTRFDEGGAVFSPDGRWLAYHSNESGQDEVYVQTVTGNERKLPISIDGGKWAQWSPDGGELFYRQGRKMLVAEISDQQELKAGRPHVLFELEFPTQGKYDVTPDAKNFIMIKRGESPPLTRMTVVLNWFEELKQKVPVKR